jgi:RimJ/RimL family protein N-acetyltransferase
VSSLSRQSVSLRPLTAAGAGQIEHWFDHPEVRHRLGGRSWIHRGLVAEPPGPFRGMMVLRAHSWLAMDEAELPVGFIGGEVYDRWVRYHGEGPSGPVLSDEQMRTSMGLGYVVDPTRWRRGYGRACLEAVIVHPDAADVDVFFCGIDADNEASQRCAMAVGFRLVDPEPDHEEMLSFRRDRRTGE